MKEGKKGGNIVIKLQSQKRVKFKNKQATKTKTITLFSIFVIRLAYKIMVSIMISSYVFIIVISSLSHLRRVMEKLTRQFEV